MAFEKSQDAAGVPLGEQPSGLVCPTNNLWRGGARAAPVPVHVHEDIEIFHLVGSSRVVLLDFVPSERLAAGRFMLGNLEAAGAAAPRQPTSLPPLLRACQIFLPRKTCHLESPMYQSPTLIIYCTFFLL